MTTIPNSDAFKVANLSGGTSKMDLSKQWAARPHDERFLSLADLEAFKLQEWNESSDAVLETRQVEAVAADVATRDDLNKLTFRLDDGREAAASHWAFSQICQRAKAPGAYLRTLPAPLVADNLNWSLRQNAESVKTFERHNGSHELRAVTGPDYGRIADHDVIRAVRNVAGNGTGDARWKIPGTMDWRTMIYDPNTPVTPDTTTLFASDRDLFMFLVDDRNPIEVGKVRNPQTGIMEPDLMFRGFYVTNSEVGASALKLCAFYLRAICCNRIMWGVEGFEEMTIRHTKLAPDRFIHQAEPALISFADGSVSRLIEGVEKAKAAKVAQDDEEALAFLKARNLSRENSKRILELVEAEEGTKARTAWDFAQGITALARNAPNNDGRVELELTARKILDKVAA
jgi:uncharacterized protein DUF932